MMKQNLIFNNKSEDKHCMFINNILRNIVKIVLLAKPNRFDKKYSQNTCVFCMMKYYVIYAQKNIYASF